MRGPLDELALAADVVPVVVARARLLDGHRELGPLLEQGRDARVHVVDAATQAPTLDGRLGRSDGPWCGRVAQVLVAAQVVHEVAELGERERLLRVGAGRWRVGVDLDDDAVRADGRAGHGEGPNEWPVPGAVRGVDDDRAGGCAPG